MTVESAFSHLKYLVFELEIPREGFLEECNMTWKFLELRVVSDRSQNSWKFPLALSLSFSVVHLHPRLLFFSSEQFLVDLNFNRRILETKMKRKNRSRFFDDDEVLVVDILLQIPHIIFESESRLPFNWGFRRE